MPSALRWLRTQALPLPGRAGLSSGPGGRWSCWSRPGVPQGGLTAHVSPVFRKKGDLFAHETDLFFRGKVSSFNFVYQFFSLNWMFSRASGGSQLDG